jgi:hypothetical protein
VNEGVIPNGLAPRGSSKPQWLVPAGPDTRRA